MITVATADFSFADHGSVWLCVPSHQDAFNHLIENTGDEALWWGNSLVVEPRYVLDLANALCAAGFSVEH